MKVLGRKIVRMVEELKLGPMEQDMKENTSKERNMGKETFSGRMDRDTKVSLLTTTSMELESMNGRMVDVMKALGRITKWMEKEFLIGLINDDTSGSIKMIKRKEWDISHGQTVDNIKEVG